MPPDPSSPDLQPVAAVPSGLCDVCRHARPVTSGRGSRFILCERSRTDPAFPRYPRLPVLACLGFEAGPPERSVSSEPRA